MTKRTGARPPAARRGDAGYIPEAGDLVWLSFSPQAGREQAGRRPAVVFSPHAYNSRSGLCLACPVTSQAKGYPFEVPLPDGLAVTGIILVDHVRSADWQVRHAECAGRVPPEVLEEVRARLMPLLGN